MVQVIPQADIGEQFGAGLGAGISSGMETLASQLKDYKQQEKFNDYLDKNYDPDASIQENLLTISKAPGNEKLKASFMQQLAAAEKEKRLQEQQDNVMSLISGSPEGQQQGLSPQEGDILGSDKQSVTEKYDNIDLNDDREIDPIEKGIARTDSFSSRTPDPNWDQITAVSLNNPNAGKALQAKAASIEKRKKEEARRNEDISTPFLKTIDEKREALKSKDLSLDTIGNALSTGSRFTMDWLANKTGLNMLATPEGRQLNAATKNFFMGDLEKISSGGTRGNQFLERLLSDALQKAGNDPRANWIIYEIQKANRDIDENYIENSSKVADALEKKHGFIHRNISSVTNEISSDYEESRKKELLSRLSGIQDMSEKEFNNFLKQERKRNTFDEEGEQKDINKPSGPQQENQPTQGKFVFKDDIEDRSREEEPSLYKDALKQGGIGFTTGLAGTYGSLMDLLGLQSKDPLMPGDQLETDQKFDILGKFKDPDYKPNFKDIFTLTDFSDVDHRAARLPSGKDIKEIYQMMGVDTDPETMAGRYANRIGELAGAGTTFGSPQFLSAGAAGTVGQSLEEVGAPPWAQALAEISTFVATGIGQNLFSKSKATASNPEISERIEKLRGLGYSEEAIQTAVNAAEKEGILQSIGKETTKSETAIQESKSAMRGLVDETLSSSFPGIEDVNVIKEGASKIFESVAEQGQNITINNPKPFLNESKKIISELKNTLANTPEELQVISFLEGAFENAAKNPSGQTFVNFYQGLNRMGKWVNPGKKENIFGRIKTSIKDSFKKQGKQGKELAKTFEKANQSWTKLKQAEKVSEKLAPALKDEGTDFKRLESILDRPKNKELFIDSMGKSQYNLLKDISKQGKSIETMQKNLAKSGLADKAIKGGSYFKLANSIYNLNPTGIISSLGLVAGKEIVQRLATNMLVDPSYQKLTLQIMKSLNNGSMRSAERYMNEFADKVEELD